MRVGIDGRAFQPGFKGHLGRGIGLYAAELVRALVRIGGVELVMHFDPWRSIDETRVPVGLARAWYPRGPLGREASRAVLSGVSRSAADHPEPGTGSLRRRHGRA